MNYNKFKNYFFKKYLYYLAGGAVSGLGAYMLYKIINTKKVAAKSKDIKLFTLTQDEAELRSSIVSEIKYNLFLQLNPLLANKGAFEGAISIEFKLSSSDSNIFIDYAGKVKSISINGEDVGIAYEGERLYLKRKYLFIGHNKVNVKFESNYGNYNKGLVFYQDQDDNRSYVYTDCEPCYTHLIFPCFNQPSLKSNIKLTVSSFEDWTVLSSGCNNSSKFVNLDAQINSKVSVQKNNKIISKKNDIDLFLKDLGSKLNLPKINKDFVLHSFEEVENISVGAFSIIAGHYTLAEISDNISIYLRNSILDKQVNYKFICQTTNKIFNWLNTNLKTNIVNSNFNIVFVPYLKSESSAFLNSVVLNEDLLGADKKLLTSTFCTNNKYDKMNLFAHLACTTALRWFNIETTPQWWDDIWFSKGFSIFFAFHILKQLSDMYPDDYPDFSDAWMLFSAKKAYAMDKDSYSRTHPVKNTIINSFDSIYNLDAITFFKSASIVKYVYTLIGPELFLKGLKHVFGLYSGKSINSRQILDIFNNLAKERDMTQNPSILIEKMISNIGINDLQIMIEYNDLHKDKTIKSISIKQVLKDSNSSYYNFKAKLLLIDENNVKRVINIDIKDEEYTNIKELEGFKQPKFILLNKDDICYFKQIFSNEDINYICTMSNDNVLNSHDRLLIIRDMTAMVKGQQIKPSVYLDCVFNLIQNEEDMLILEVLLKSTMLIINNYVSFEKQKKYKPLLLNILIDMFYSKFVKIKNTAVNTMLELIDYKNETDMDSLLFLLQKTELNNKISLLKGSSEIIKNKCDYNNFDLEGITYKTKKNLVQSIYEAIYFDIKTKLKLKNMIFENKEVEKYFKYTLDAALPDKYSKNLIWKHLIKNSNEKSKINDAYMKGFARKSQYSFIKKYLEEQFFDDFEYVKNNHSVDYTEKFINLLYPSIIVDDSIIEKTYLIKNNLKIDDFKLNKIIDKSKYYNNLLQYNYLKLRIKQFIKQNKNY